MSIKQRISSVLAALIFILASGCSTVGPASDAPMVSQKQEKAQERESLVPSPSSKGEMDDVERQKSKESDDMERLD